jgi:hypothetical protein
MELNTAVKSCIIQAHACGKSYKTCYGRNLQAPIKSWSASSWKSSATYYNVWGYIQDPSLKHLKGASLGQAPALHEHIRLGWTTTVAPW